GILFSTPFTATAEIAFNHDIHGRRGDGIHFADGLDGAEVDIIGNRKIEGGDDGIDVHGLVEGGAALDIAWNWHIEGRDGDGIVLRGVDGWRTSVDISHNLKIEGEDNGIHLAAPRDLRAFFDGGAWAIDGASVSIADNATIVGRHDDGIRVEGVRGNGSGRTTNLAITGNGGFWPWQGIFGKDNGIAITRVLYGTWTACDCYEGTVGLSGWAVENAKVVIAGNSLIEGEHDDGILIQGVHATKGDDAPWWWTPEASVEINGNGTILGKDNGIAVTRGFDLVADDGWIGWNDGNLIGAVKNAPDFSDGLLKALHHFGEDDAVTLSAWAIENASVEIAGNGLVKGRNENGILVEGIHSTAWQKFCDVGPWSQTGNASLLIAGNGWGHGWNGIIGGDNGIRLARGVDLRFDGWYGGQELELGAWAVQNATATIVGNALVKGEHGDGILVEGVLRDAWSHGHGDDADLLIAGNREISGKWDGIHLGWGVDLARTDYESLRWEGIWLSAWAIDSISGTSVVVAHNDDIEGKRGDGILVEGVWADPKGHQFGDNLLIADNGTIKGGWDGIALTRGFDLSGEGWLSGHLIRKVFDSAADHDALLGELGFKPGLDLTAWAILYGRVSIDDNDRIEGKGGDGIFVKGVRGTGFEWQPNLAITGNGGWWPWQGIFGKHDGIHIDSVLYDTWVDCGCYERGTPGLSAWAVENAKVLIAGNSLIKGERDDGIRIEGVHATEAGDRFDDEYGGFGFGWLTPSASVSIKDNKTILGKDNGIAITRGFDLKADDGWIGWKDWKLIWAVTGGTDVAHDLGKALFKAFDKTDVTLSAWAIENADVAITGNGLIKGHDDNGILVEGIHSTAWQKLCDVYPWSQTGDAELLIAGNGRTLGHDGGDDVVTAAFAGGGDHGIGGGGKGIIGGDNGIRIARGIDLYLGTVEYESTSLDLGAWGIQDAVVKIVGNGLIQGEDRNGIEVDGVKDGGTQGFSLFGFADCCGTDRLNLAILGNGTIQGGEGEDRLEGGENGIEIGRGLDLHFAKPSFGGPTRSLASETTTFGLGGGFSPLDLLGLGGLTLDVTAVAIDGGHVLIDSNDRIAGGGANGILVEGVRDTGPDCFCGDEGSLWNLDITRNQLVWGAENGILLDRGYGLSVGVALSGHESFAIAALTPGITASGWAIDDATVRIAGNTAIWGGSEDGIQVRGGGGGPNGLDDGTQDADQQ
ncbi:MAG: hypothetical protein IRY94_13345, partial [Rhodospirillaceae bacterium]|nr:hypothetical protein [Rhodospirillaceae bacterium]